MGNLTAAFIERLRRNPPTKVQTFNHAPALVLRANGGGKLYWRYKYRWNGKQTDISLGEYTPNSSEHVSIQLAEERFIELRKKLKSGIKPYQFWKDNTPLTLSPTFGEVLNLWFEREKMQWSETYANTVNYRLNTYILPKLEKKDIKQITKLEIIELLQAVQSDGKIELGHRVRPYLNGIFTLAIHKELITQNPVEGVNAALLKRPKVKHLAKLSEYELSDFFSKLHNAETYNALPITKLAILFTILTAARTIETRMATWNQIINLDGEEPFWDVPPEIMKMDRKHIVPLSKQSVHVLKQAKELYPNSKIIFPTSGVRKSKSGYMSRNAMLHCVHYMGYFGKTTVHGIARGTFSTVCNDEGFHPDWIELSLAHVKDNDVRGAYNSASYLKQRRTMLNWWGDYIMSKGAQLNIVE